MTFVVPKRISFLFVLWIIHVTWFFTRKCFEMLPVRERPANSRLHKNSVLFQLLMWVWNKRHQAREMKALWMEQRSRSVHPGSHFTNALYNTDQHHNNNSQLSLIDHKAKNLKSTTNLYFFLSRSKESQSTRRWRWVKFMGSIVWGGETSGVFASEMYRKVITNRLEKRRRRDD